MLFSDCSCRLNNCWVLPIFVERQYHTVRIFDQSYRKRRLLEWKRQWFCKRTSNPLRKDRSFSFCNDYMIVIL